MFFYTLPCTPIRNARHDFLRKLVRGRSGGSREIDLFDGKKISRSQAKHVSQKDGNEASVINKGRKVINGFQDFWGKQKFESGIENRQKEFVR